MAPRALKVDELASVLPPGGLTLVSASPAESDLLVEMVAQAGDALGDMTFSGIFVPGLNKPTYSGGSQTRVLSFFQTPQLRAEAHRVDFVPVHYAAGQALYRSLKPRAVLAMVSPPDENGMCSFGAETAWIPDNWRNAAVRVAHINPAMPRTAGDPGIPFAELTGYIEGEQPLKGMPDGAADPVSEAIARHAAAFIEDGATIQTGLGKVPDCILDMVQDRRNLRIHTGLIGDGALRLVRSGAMATGKSALVGVAIGSPALYAGLDDPHFDFRPISVTHDPRVSGAAEQLITVNGALEVDLFGQTYAEVGPKGAMSGPGGASDFTTAARLSPRGIRMICLPADAGKGAITRIIDPRDAKGPVSLGRLDTDIVVTEHGAADLRGKGHNARAEALIAIAAPAFRDALAAAWSRIADGL
ncbi:acetyl-CoA hydrolase/transferase family protein [Novosphingobium colocasiae]|uniref:Acetyl-CoA hydrolase n=1 Tax=Novosphingobium colocasiae TaxID=1256513 RepID=A0A918UCI9_9SPHN|nr:acetyl-CoA hydrolase/transferase C-terminal domain-containing protein [Novosphingobium colocasiae]GGY89922.1 acetyl-CoA hydrolase [Novosphingobium colocasiae]